MQSDKFLFRQADTALDKIERFAACYDFKTKEVLQIRLLAEEVIAVIAPTLTLSDGRCWITTNEKSFAVTIDCDAGISGLDEATKKQLLKMSRGEKSKGIFGMIGKVFEFLSVPQADYSPYMGHRMIYSYGMDAGYSGYYWNPEFQSDLLPAAPPKEGKNIDNDLEISIIEGYADDIQVSLQRGNTGIRLEITVVKYFNENQTTKIEL